ncbi:hypothetical protein EBT31_07470 [bacterium]|nr:hypothetical protein [bacterium]
MVLIEEQPRGLLAVGFERLPDGRLLELCPVCRVAFVSGTELTGRACPECIHAWSYACPGSVNVVDVVETTTWQALNGVGRVAELLRMRSDGWVLQPGGAQ